MFSKLLKSRRLYEPKSEIRVCLVGYLKFKIVSVIKKNNLIFYSNPNFIGSSCQTDIRACSRVSCLNNGNCSDYNGTFICTCPTNYYGVYCENLNDLCKTKNCSQQGNCFLNKTTNMAQCKLIKNNYFRVYGFCTQQKKVTGIGVCTKLQDFLRKS